MSLGLSSGLPSERERFRLLGSRIFTRLMEGAEHSGRVEEALTYGLKLLRLTRFRSMSTAH